MILKRYLRTGLRHFQDWTRFYPGRKLLYLVDKRGISLTPEQEEQLLAFIREHPHYSQYYEGIYILLNLTKKREQVSIEPIVDGKAGFFFLDK